MSPRLAAHRIAFEDFVAAPLRRVFRFFSDPVNLPRIMPPELDTRLLRVDHVPAPDPEGRGPPAAGPGTEIAVSIRPVPGLPLRATFVVRIVELERDRCFVDEQVRGPFRRWRHRHLFAAATRAGAEGTVVRDEIELELPLGAAGRLASRILVAPQLRRTFRHRQRALRRLLASGA